MGTLSLRSLSGLGRMVLFLAWRNIRRNLRRSMLSLAAISLGVVGLALAGGFVEDMYQQLADRTIHAQLGHLQVGRAGFRAEGAGRTEAFLLKDVPAVKKALSSDPDVISVMARISFGALIASDREELAVEVEAVEPAPEAALSTHLATLGGRQLRGGDRMAVVLGEGVAKQLRVAPGAQLNLTAATVDGALNSYELEVVGVFRSISKEFDERTIRIPLELAQELLQTPGANTIVIQLRDTAATDRAQQRLLEPMRRMGLEVHSWHEISDFYRGVRDTYAMQFGILRIIALVLMVMGVVNSLNMTVFERTAEFGTMRALGNRGEMVFALIVIESTLIGLIAVAAAVVISLVSAAVLSYVGIPMPPPPNSEAGYLARIAITPAVMLGAAAVGVLSATLAGVIPALRAASMPVVDGLRHAV